MCGRVGGGWGWGVYSQHTCIVNACVCVCVCVCVMCVHVYSCVCAYVRACACVHVCVRVCVHVCVRACVRASVRACVRVCVRACVPACVCRSRQATLACRRRQLRWQKATSSNKNLKEPQSQAASQQCRVCRRHSDTAQGDHEIQGHRFRTTEAFLFQ